jgi:hypothetical protein
LRAGHSDYHINSDALAYMEANKLPKYVLKPIIANIASILGDERQWNDLSVTFFR